MALITLLESVRDIGVEPIRSLAAELRAQLRAIPGVSVCDAGAIKTGIVTFTVAGLSAVAVRDRLRRAANQLANRAIVTKSIEVLSDKPLISFTFDDFPLSAATAGADILERYGARGTFYASGSLCGPSVGGSAGSECSPCRAPSPELVLWRRPRAC